MPKCSTNVHNEPNTRGLVWKMGAELGLCSFAFNLVYFSMLWLHHCVKEENHDRLKVFLHQREAIHFYKPLKEAGMHFLVLFLTESSYAMLCKLKPLEGSFALR